MRHCSDRNYELQKELASYHKKSRICTNYLRTLGGHTVVASGRTVSDGRRRGFNGRGYIMIDQTCSNYNLIMESALKHSWKKKLIMWSCRKKKFQIFENYIFCEIFTPPRPTHQIRDFLSYDVNSFCNS